MRRILENLLGRKKSGSKSGEQLTDKLTIPLPCTMPLRADPPIQLSADARYFAGDPPVEAVMLLTRGLWERGHPELAFIIRHATDTDVRTVADLVVSLLDAIAEGSVVGAGEFTWFDERGSFGRPDFAALGYARPEQLDLDEILLKHELEPNQVLCALSLTRAEFEVAKRDGLARVLARLGHASQYYPYPPWIDVNRKSVIADGAVESFLNKVGGASFVPGFCATYHDRILHISARPDCSSELADALFQRDAIAIATDYQVAKFDASFVWTPGEESLTVIKAGPVVLSSAGGFDLEKMGRTNGNFVCLLKIDSHPTGVNIIEDGFGVMFNADLWAEFRSAVRDLNSFKMVGEDDKYGLEFVWSQ